MSDGICDKGFACRKKAQIELNRQALVSLGKRLSELEQKMVDLCANIETLSQYAGESLAIAKQFQRIILEAQDLSTPVGGDRADDEGG